MTFKIKQIKEPEVETIKVSEKFFVQIKNSKGEKKEVTVMRTFTDYEGSGGYEIEHYYYDAEDKEIHADELEKFIGVDEDIDMLLEELNDLHTN